MITRTVRDSALCTPFITQKPVASLHIAIFAFVFSGVGWPVWFLSVMFVCYDCRKAEPTTLKFRAHLQRHNVLGELTYPIFCRNCKSSYASLYNFMRHVRHYHASLADSTEQDLPGLQHNSLGRADISASAVANVAAENDIPNLYDDVRVQKQLHRLHNFVLIVQFHTVLCQLL